MEATLVLPKTYKLATPQPPGPNLLAHPQVDGNTSVKLPYD